MTTAGAQHPPKSAPPGRHVWGSVRSAACTHLTPKSGQCWGFWGVGVGCMWVHASVGCMALMLHIALTVPPPHPYRHMLESTSVRLQLVQLAISWQGSVVGPLSEGRQFVFVFGRSVQVYNSSV